MENTMNRSLYNIIMDNTVNDATQTSNPPPSAKISIIDGNLKIEVKKIHKVRRMPILKNIPKKNL
jgi:hypothetical protein